MFVQQKYCNTCGKETQHINGKCGECALRRQHQQEEETAQRREHFIESMSDPRSLAGAVFDLEEKIKRLGSRLGPPTADL